MALLALIGACAAQKNRVAKDEPTEAVISESEESTSVSSASEERAEEKAEEKNVPKSGTLETSAAQKPKLSEAERIAIAKRAAEIAKRDKKDEEKTESADEKTDETETASPEEENVLNSGTQTPAPASVSAQESQPSAPAPATPVTTAQESAAPTHTHTWIEQTTTVHHEEVGHTETVVVSEAWDEEVPVYENIMPFSLLSIDGKKENHD